MATQFEPSIALTNPMNTFFFILFFLLTVYQRTNGCPARDKRQFMSSKTAHKAKITRATLLNGSGIPQYAINHQSNQKMIPNTITIIIV